MSDAPNCDTLTAALNAYDAGLCVCPTQAALDENFTLIRRRPHQPCTRCGNVSCAAPTPGSLPELGVLITSNGTRQVRNWCPACGHYITVKSKGHNIDDLPVIQDNRAGCCDGGGCPTCVDTECDHCGSRRHLQIHHWAPYALFGAEANEWPTSWLCQPCHSRWHSTVTPNMRRIA
jgi:hypothetical protein